MFIIPIPKIIVSCSMLCCKFFIDTHKKTMIKAKTIVPAVLLALLALNVESMNIEMLSDLAENTRKTFKNSASTLDQAHTKCAEHLKTKLGEFLQKVPKTINNDGTEKLGKLVEEKLNKEINVLMGSCDPATVGVAQFVTTKVEPKDNSLNIQQLVIQKIKITPNLREVMKPTNASSQPPNCTSGGSTGQTGMMHRSECDALVAEWQRKNDLLQAENLRLTKTELQLTAQLRELVQLEEERKIMMRSLNENYMRDEETIAIDAVEITRLKEIVVVRDAEIDRLNVKKMTSDKTIQQLSEENAMLREQLKNSVDRSLLEAEKLKYELEHNDKINCRAEKANLNIQIDNLNNQLNQASELQSESEQCQLDKDYCQSSLNQKKIDYSSIKETLQTCETKLSNCQQGTGQQSANLKKCMDDIAAYQKSLSSIQITLEQEKTGLVFIQTQYERSKTESENCRSLLRQKEIDCINMENDLKKNLKTSESAKTICETGTTKLNQELASCKADAAVITTDNSKKSGAIATCESEKTKASGELIDCLTIKDSLAMAIAGKLKIQEQLDQINLRNKNADLSLLTVKSTFLTTVFAL
ncbi:hypothetical protein DAPPUDRAFT_309277 [Daphnia pulex]|uniref:Uncharacterized protein n=1 Tax=Daphnia pulex TaxID=6669 RepID=E9HBP2_DAPPU|nr:hypothetical protein DAPPUDRAFT_309277 [Daphnia pulex]|eukprot:EFX70885.1 hypothetical protein DAPPUDRAFT_309277 [Daphnia pulex]